MLVSQRLKTICGSPCTLSGVAIQENPILFSKLSGSAYRKFRGWNVDGIWIGTHCIDFQIGTNIDYLIKLTCLETAFCLLTGDSQWRTKCIPYCDTEQCKKSKPNPTKHY